MFDKDYCENCPMYWNECGYYGDWDEGCNANFEGWFNGKYNIICTMPNIIKKNIL